MTMINDDDKMDVYVQATRMMFDARVSEWGLSHVRRHDLHQADIAPLMSALVNIAVPVNSMADIAPLMSALVNIAVPVNSMGSLPVEYLGGSDQYRAEALYANARQLLAQYTVRRRARQAHSLPFMFAPYKYLQPDDEISYITKIRNSLNKGKYSDVIDTCHILMQLSESGIRYYHNYDRPGLTLSITLAFIGWILTVVCLILQHDAGVLRMAQNSIEGRRAAKKSHFWFTIVLLWGFLTLVLNIGEYSVSQALQFWLPGLAILAPRPYNSGSQALQFWLPGLAILAPRLCNSGSQALQIWSLLAEKSAQGMGWRQLLYHVLPVVVWGTLVYRWLGVLRVSWLLLRHYNMVWETAIRLLAVFLGVQILVFSFHARLVLVGGLVVAGCWPLLLHSRPAALKPTPSGEATQGDTALMLSWLGACLLLSSFAILPPVVGMAPVYPMVLLAGFIALLLGCFALYWCGGDGSGRASGVSTGSTIQGLTVLTTLLIISSTSSSLGHKTGLPLLNQVAAWTLLVVSMVMPLVFGSRLIMGRLLCVCLALLCPFLLLSIRHEAFFFLALCIAMMLWTLLEFYLTGHN
ncbi:GPI ethanolamine phosphate transferase 1 C-terminal, partial [Trinorchestia longiramus]